jgi:hypothetical protein
MRIPLITLTRRKWASEPSTPQRGNSSVPMDSLVSSWRFVNSGYQSISIRELCILFIRIKWSILYGSIDKEPPWDPLSHMHAPYFSRGNNLRIRSCPTKHYREAIIFSIEWVNAPHLGKSDSVLDPTVRLGRIAVRVSIVWGEEGNRDQ